MLEKIAGMGEGGGRAPCAPPLNPPLPLVYMSLHLGDVILITVFAFTPQNSVFSREIAKTNFIVF